MKATIIQKAGKPTTVTIRNVTVKVYERSRPTIGGGTRTVWDVADYSSGSRRFQGFSDIDKAIAEAKRIADMLASGEAEAASFRGADAASYGRAMEFLQKAGIEISLEAVAERHVEAVNILGTDRILEACREYIRRNPTQRPIRSVKEAADEMLEVKTKQKASARYLQDLKYQLGKITEKFKVNVGEVTTADLQAWLDGMEAAPRSVRNARSAARSFFRFAEARGYIAKGENPAIETERIKSKTDEDIEIYTPEELARLLRAADDVLRPVLAIQAFTGLRTAELMRLDWAAVKLARGHIEIKAANAKTASRRLVPILPNLAAWLKDCAKKTGKIFPHGNDRYHEMQRETAGRTKTDDAEAVKLKHNALRHSFISYRVADVQNIPQVALEAGNSPAMIFSHYRELTTPAEAKTWFAITPEQPENVVNLNQKAAA